MSCFLHLQCAKRGAYLTGQSVRALGVPSTGRVLPTSAEEESCNVWHGLQRKSRRQNISAGKSPSREKKYLQSKAFDSALKAGAFHGGPASAVRLLDAVRAVDKTYVPDALTAAAILQSVVTAAPSALKADAAMGAMMRLKEIYYVRTSAPLLAVVASAAKMDPVVDNRSRRVLSIVRLMRRDRIMPSPALVWECFDSCISGLDLSTALALFELARSAGLFVAPAADPSSFGGAGHARFRSLAAQNMFPPQDESIGNLAAELPYYNGIIKASIFSGQHDVAAVAIREMSARGIVGDRETRSLLVALYADTGFAEKANDMMAVMRSRKEIPTAAAYAAMIRLAGDQGKPSSAVMLFEEFEQRLLAPESGHTLHSTLSTICSVQSSASALASSLAIRSARGDVVLAMFQAFRTLGEVDRALTFLAHLRQRYSFVPTGPIYMMLCEVCWRSVPQRLDVVEQLRSEMKKVLPRAQPVPRHVVKVKRRKRKSKGEEAEATKKKQSEKLAESSPS